MKKALFICFVFLLPTLAVAQAHPGFSKAWRYSGDTIPRAEYISALLYDSLTGKVFLALQEESFTQQSGGSILYSTDIDGNMVNEVFDSVPNTYLSYYTVAASGDGHYLYWGGISFLNADSAASRWRLCKTDKDLNVIWQKDYPLATRDGSIAAIKTISGSGDIMLLGSKFTGTGDNAGYPYTPNRIHLARVDSGGNILASYTPGPANNNGSDMAVTDDGNYLVAGRTFGWGQNNGSAYTLKTDVNMDEDWHRIYNQNAYTAWPLGMIKTEDDIESYLITGQAQINQGGRGKGFVYKTDAIGNPIWQRNLARNDDWSHGFWAITNGTNGSYVAAGIARDGGEEPSPRGWLVKLDKDGNEIWNKIVTAGPRENDHEYLYNIVALPDGGFMAAGSTVGQDSFGRWTSDGWLVRVDSNGCMDPGCLNGGVGVKESAASPAAISLYPNPTVGTVRLVSERPFARGMAVVLLDRLGRKVRQLPAPAPGAREMQYDLSGPIPGIYYLELNSASGREVKKVTIVK